MSNVPFNSKIGKINSKTAFVEYCTHLESQYPMIDSDITTSDPLWLIKDILYHLMLPLTPNGIREYYRYYALDLTTFPFQALIERAGLIAEKINELLLSKVGEVIVYTEDDETFKGRYTIFLVVIDKTTGFLLFFKQIPNRKQETITSALEPLRNLFPNLKIVFTDLAVYYPKVLADLFPGVDHQLCLIHGLRALFGEYNKIRHRYNKVLGNRMIKSRQLHDLKLTIRYRQKKQANKKRALQKSIDKRDALYQALGIGPNQKGINQQYPQVKKITGRINVYRTEIRSMGKTLAHNYTKRREFEQELMKLGDEEKPLWAKYMESRRLWKRFKSLLRGELPDFPSAWEKITQILQKAYKKKEIRAFVAKIQHLMKDYPDLFTLAKQNKEKILAPNFWNTNRVESFNSIFRSFSDLRRHFPCPAQSDAICALFQLYYNTTPRRSKQGDCLSPIERFGVNLHGKSWVQLLFEPVPRILITTV